VRQKASATNLAALFANKERNMAGFDLAKKALKRLGDSITAPQKAAQAAQAAQKTKRTTGPSRVHSKTATNSAPYCGHEKRRGSEEKSSG
jgi:hypothetical protein